MLQIEALVIDDIRSIIYIYNMFTVHATVLEPYSQHIIFFITHDCYH